MFHPMYGRGNFYDVRNLPYHNGYHAPHPMEMDYHRSRPQKLTPRVLNRRFKKVTIQLNETRVLLISVQVVKSKHPYLVFSQCEGSYENKTDTVSIPEALVVPFIQQLHKLSKWRPSTSGSMPSSHGLTFDETVFRTQIVDLSEPDTPLETRLYSIKVLAETRARDPLDRKELSSVFIPLETNHLMKVKEALNDVLVAAVESPLYHTKSHQGIDGSKFYLDLIRDEEAHYLKISQVTRDFRSILHIPADDLEAMKGHLESCLKAMKGQEEQKTKKKRSRQNRRRHKRSEAKGSQSSEAEEDEKEKEAQDDTKDSVEKSEQKEEDKENEAEKVEQVEQAEKLEKDDSEKAESGESCHKPEKADDDESSKPEP